MIIIPAVDIKQGKVVRLFQGDFDRQTQYKQDPVSAALHWQELGAKLIHIVDLDGALTGEPKNKDLLIKIIEATNIEVEVGGGLRDLEIINELLDKGAARVILGSKAFSDYSFLDNFKSVVNQRLAVSIDAKFMQIKKQGASIDIIMDVANFGWLKSKQVSLNEILKNFFDRGIRFVNFTSINRDGTLVGVDIDATRAVLDCVKKFPGLNMIASGGIASISDIENLKKLKSLYGVIVGKALYEGKLDFVQAKRLLQETN